MEASLADACRFNKMATVDAYVGNLIVHGQPSLLADTVYVFYNRLAKWEQCLK